MPVLTATYFCSASFRSESEICMRLSCVMLYLCTSTAGAESTGSCTHHKYVCTLTLKVKKSACFVPSRLIVRAVLSHMRNAGHLQYKFSLQATHAA